MLQEAKKLLMFQRSGNPLHLEQETLKTRPGQKQDESVFGENKIGYVGYGEDERRRKEISSLRPSRV